MISHLWLLLFVLIKCSFAKTSITNYPTVHLLENTPLNTLVVHLTASFNITKSSKLVLLNMAGFELDMFSIINESIYTINYIDREQFISAKYCLDSSYCKIELHILVDDGLAYWVIPIHIVDENDNQPEFAQKEIELKFRENVINGYKLPFGGAKDVDEGRNGELHYVLDCSNDSIRNKTFVNQYIQSSINCFPLFQLMILSQSPSSSVNYDRLALKFLPSSSVTIQNEYKLRLYAIDNNENGKQLDNSMSLIVKIERKEKVPEFSLSHYEFVVTINSSLQPNASILGRVHAMANDPSQVIHYKLLTDDQRIKINSLTGELILSNVTFREVNNEMELLVQASTSSKEKSSKIVASNSKVKIIFRYSDLLNNISYHFQTKSFQNQYKSYRLNSSRSFLIDNNLDINEELLRISLISPYYPTDKYILSLDNYLTIFSLTSSPSLNNYVLKTRRRPIPKAIYMLNIGVKHKLSQQWLPNLRIELIVIDEWTTTTSSTLSTVTRTSMTTTTPHMIITNTSIYVEPVEFCVANKNYILHELSVDDVDEKIALLQVIETNSIVNNNRSLSFLSINESEIIVDGCRMHLDRLENPLNTSLRYQLCAFSNDDECYNLTLTNNDDLMAMKSEHDFRRWLLPMKPIEVVMFILSIIFIIISIALIFLICRLKGVHICLTIKNYLFYGKKYGLNNPEQLTSSPQSKMTQRVHSIVIRESRSPSFEPIGMKLDMDEPYIFNIDHLLEREPLPSTNMFTLPSPAQLSSSSSMTCSLQREDRTRSNIENRPITTPRTSSSSSFLQETKQLLDMISSNPNSDLERLASEV